MEINRSVNETSLNKLICTFCFIFIMIMGKHVFERIEVIGHLKFYLLSLSLMLIINVAAILSYRDYLLYLLVFIQFIFGLIFSYEVYLGHSIHFWILPTLIWCLSDIFFRSADFYKKLRSVQFFVAAIYSTSGFQKFISLISQRDQFSAETGVLGVLFTDANLYYPQVMIQFMLENVWLFNFLLVSVVLLQLGAVLWFFLLPYRIFGLLFILFHLFNSIFLGVVFYEPLMILGLFFILQDSVYFKTNA